MRVTIYVSVKNLDAINNFFDLKIPSEHYFTYSHQRTAIHDAEISLPFRDFMVFKMMQTV
jgi:hypothetical protein